MPRSNLENTPVELRDLLEEFEEALQTVNERRLELIRARSRATALRVQLVDRYGVNGK